MSDTGVGGVYTSTAPWSVCSVSGMCLWMNQYHPDQKSGGLAAKNYDEFLLPGVDSKHRMVSSRWQKASSNLMLLAAPPRPREHTRSAGTRLVAPRKAPGPCRLAVIRQDGVLTSSGNILRVFQYWPSVHVGCPRGPFVRTWAFSFQIVDSYL